MTRLRTEVETLLKQILKQPFEICWCGEPWCQQGGPGNPILHLTDKGIEDYVKQVALHEAVHLVRGRGGHPEVFWNHLEELTKKHLGVGLNEHQVEMKRDYLNRAMP